MNWAKWAYSSWTVSGNLIQSPMSSNCNLICSLHSNSTKLRNLELDNFFLSKKDLEKHFPDVHKVSTRVDKLFIFKSVSNPNTMFVSEVKCLLNSFQYDHKSGKSIKGGSCDQNI